MDNSKLENMEEVLTRSSDLFLRYGLKSNTMDDIARHLGISKKTLYQYVSNKEDLLEKCFHFTFNQISENLIHISKEAPDAITELFEMDRSLIENRKKRNPVVLHDLKKFYPRLQEQIYRLNQKHIQKYIQNNIERGMEEGLYRNDLHPEILAKIYVNRQETLVNEDLFPLTKFSFEEIIYEHLSYHIRGLATLAGIIKLETVKKDFFQS